MGLLYTFVGKKQGTKHTDRFPSRIMDREKVKELEDRIAELERRWPAHSAPPAMYEELERLEAELEEARSAEDGDTDAR
jgi:uncharacterized small protein (DUF1192 family)